VDAEEGIEPLEPGRASSFGDLARENTEGSLAVRCVTGVAVAGCPCPLSLDV
jgi:hypothetical protein